MSNFSIKDQVTHWNDLQLYRALFDFGKTPKTDQKENTLEIATIKTQSPKAKQSGE